MNCAEQAPSGHNESGAPEQDAGADWMEQQSISIVAPSIRDTQPADDVKHPHATKSFWVICPSTSSGWDVGPWHTQFFNEQAASVDIIRKVYRGRCLWKLPRKHGSFQAESIFKFRIF